MKISCLVEDTTKNEKLKSEHGISFYVETDQHQLLFDVGQSDLFIKNAQYLNIDLSKVDILVISHGHYDHGGGLSAFIKLNSTAKIYISKHAFKDYYSMRATNEMTYNGLDQNLIEHKRFIFVDEQLKIDDQLTIFSDVKSNEFYPRSNQTLFKKVDQQFVNDDFIHEQNLIIKENNHFALFAGCAHHGIVNIVNRASELIHPHLISTVISGFHFVSRYPELAETEQNIKRISDILLNFDIMYYTGHCTGLKAYDILKKQMKDHVEYFSTGFQIDLK